MSKRVHFIFPILLSLIVIPVSNVLGSDTGFLRIYSDPMGALIAIEGRQIGQTPIEKYPLPVGQYKVSATDPIRNIIINKTIEVVADSIISLDFALRNEYGVIKIESNPSGCEVAGMSITRYGKTPIAADQIIPGKYTIEVQPSSKKYLPTSQEIVVSKGEPKEITIDLQRNLARRNKIILTSGFTVITFCGYYWCAVGALKEKRVMKWKTFTSFSVGTLGLIGLSVVSFVF